MQGLGGIEQPLILGDKIARPAAFHPAIERHAPARDQHRGGHLRAAILRGIDPKLGGDIVGHQIDLKPLMPIPHRQQFGFARQRPAKVDLPIAVAFIGMGDPRDLVAPECQHRHALRALHRDDFFESLARPNRNRGGKLALRGKMREQRRDVDIGGFGDRRHRRIAIAQRHEQPPRRFLDALPRPGFRCGSPRKTDFGCFAHGRIIIIAARSASYIS